MSYMSKSHFQKNHVSRIQHYITIYYLDIILVAYFAQYTLEVGVAELLNNHTDHKTEPQLATALCVMSTTFLKTEM